MRGKKWVLLPLVLCAALVWAAPAKAGGPSEITMRVGDTQTVYAPLTTAGTNNGSWSSNSPAVKVNYSSGYSCNVTAKSATNGMTAILTHRYTDQSGSVPITRIQDVRVTVLPPLPTGLSVSPRSVTLAIGEGRQLTPAVTPAGADYGSYLYSSEDTSVATVSSSGYVRAAAAGSTRIQIKTRNEGKTAYCAVTVTPKTHTVRFDAGGGTVRPNTISVIPGEPYGTLPVPEKAGYRFAGWYTAAEGGTQVSSSDPANLSADQTLYARWTAKEVSLLGWTAGDSSAVILSDPDGALQACTAVYAAFFERGQMRALLPGRLLGTTVTVNGRLGPGWQVFFLDGGQFSPVCAAVTLTQ